MKNITGKIIAVVLALATFLGAVPVFAASRNLDDGIPKRIDSRVANWLCLNLLFGVPSTAAIADVGLDYGEDNQPNELFLFDRIESGPYKGAYYIYCADLSDLGKEMSLNCYGGRDCAAGSILKGYVSDSANRDHGSDTASLWWVNEHNGYYTFTNVACGLNIDTYGSTTLGDYVRAWYPDGSPEQEYAITDYAADLSGTVRTSGSTLRLRSSAPSGSTVASMPNGSAVTILDGGKTVSGFYHVRYNGKTGWASSDYITVRSAGNNNTTGSRSLTGALYGDNGGRISCGFDGYVTYRQQYGYRHEGIDFARGSGASVYSLIDGVVTNVVKGSSSNLSTIAIYDKAADKTVVYLHLAPASGISVGTNVTVGTYLGSESCRGANGVIHTHVEVRSGKRTGAAVSKDRTLENSDPTSYWNSKGYIVK